MSDDRQLAGGLMHAALPPTNEPLRIAVRRLRWFRAAFAAHVEAVGKALGCDFDLDQDALVEAFVHWLRDIERQRPKDHAERHDFFGFAAALMLRALCREMPLRARAAAQLAPEGSAAAFWPEGFACTTFCLAVHGATADQEFREQPALDASFDDLRSWWSFRENAAQDSAFAAGFLQLLLGQEPNWVMPDVFRERLARAFAA